MSADQKIENLLTEAFHQLPKSSSKKILKLMNNNFRATYTLKEVEDSFDKFDYFSNGPGSFISILFIDRNKSKNPVIINNFKKKKVLIISNLVSETKGDGKKLVEYIKNKYPKEEIFITAYNKGLIPYYEKLGFTLLPTQHKNYPMKYDPQHKGK